MRLLVAASGTGGHLFPALAVAEQLAEAKIDWLGVPDRLETTLVPDRYPLHTVALEGFQRPLGPQTLRTLWRFARATATTRSLLESGGYDTVFTTGGYIAAPAILAARSLGIPAVLHESNAIPGKVTRLLAPLCSTVALGFEAAATRLPRDKTIWTSTPVRQGFRTPQPIDLEIPDETPVVVVAGGSQGAVALNRLVREAAPVWLEAGATIVHLTGDRDADIGTLEHPRYLEMPFCDNMAGLLQRADLAVSRAGAGTLVELAISATPSLLIPYPFAAEDHQTHNARAFVAAGAAELHPQAELSAKTLQNRVLALLQEPQDLAAMRAGATKLAIADSAERVARLLRDAISAPARP